MAQRPCQSIFLQGTPCPLNWVKTKLHLETMEAGTVLEVLVDDGAPARNVPRSVQMDGHQILDITKCPEGVRIYILKQ